MLIILPFGAIVGCVVGIAWSFALATSFTTGAWRGAVAGAILGLLLLLFGKAAHMGGNIKRQEVSFGMCYMMSAIGLVGVAIAAVVWLLKVIF